jgi:ribosomal protein S18 acetylase RimI-like enzyme
MATTAVEETGVSEAERSALLASVRRLEAVSFRSFPSTTTHFDGTWAIRLTAGHPAKRLNSVNPLDPSDNANMERRIEQARRRFEAYGRQITFRQTPLAPPGLERLLDRQGWEHFDESLVMACDIAALDLGSAVDQVPLRDAGRWVDANLALCDEPRDRKAGFVEILSLVQPELGLFLTESGDGEALACVRCVRDNDLAGIFELATGEGERRRGHGRSILASALKWAASRGARTAWLQVTAQNEAAVALYRSVGFVPLYSYVYRRPAQ